MLRATIIGILVGTVGTGAGAVLGIFLKRGKKIIGVGMAFAAGVMIAVSCLELLPEAFGFSGSVTFLGFLGGTLFTFVSSLTLNVQGDELKKAGIITLLAIAIHNFPEGMAIGSAVTTNSALSIISTILLHDVPEGMAIGIPMSASGKSFFRVLLYALAAGLPTGFGAIAGAMLGASDFALCISLSFAAGAMVAVSVGELLPISKNMAEKYFALALSIGILAGALAIKLTG